MNSDQPTRLGVPFDPTSFERLHQLQASLDASQREVICALLLTPPEQAKELLKVFRVEQAELKQQRKAINAAIRGKAKNLTPEQLAQIEAIIHGKDKT